MLNSKHLMLLLFCLNFVGCNSMPSRTGASSKIRVPASGASFYCTYNNHQVTVQSACDALADRGNVNAGSCLEWVKENEQSNFETEATSVCVAIANEGFTSHLTSCFEKIKDKNFSKDYMSSCVKMARGRLPNQALKCLDSNIVN